MATIQLEEKECHQILEKSLKNRNFQIISFKILNFHNPFQGLVGEHFTLRIEYRNDGKEGVEDFFVKTLSNNPLLLSFSKTVQVYEKEVFLYELLNEYERYNIDVSFAPRGFFFKPYTVFLEDLSKWYKGTPKRASLDLEHCYSCLAVIAKFHASTIIYEKKKQEELGRKFSLNEANSKILEDKFKSKEETIATKWLASAVGGLFQLIDLVPENHISNEEFKTKLMELLSIEDSSEGLFTAILHGDLWTSNFLHSYKDGKPVETKLVDFQLLKYGFVELDVAEFLMTNTPRDRNFDTLVGHYYSKLRECLIGAGLNLELPSLRAFVTSCDNFKLAGKIHAVVDHSYTFLADEIYEDVMKSEETFRKFLFEERAKYVIESYNKNEQFRNVLHEDLLELRDLLFP